MRTLSAFAAAIFTLALHCPLGAADKPFNGMNLDGWKYKERGDTKPTWKAGIPSLDKDDPKLLALAEVTTLENLALVNMVTGHGQGLDIYSEAKWGDCRIELEVMVPKGSNSGIYVMGEYEVQVFDSHGKEKMGGGDMGAIYGAQPPRVNASKAPGEWQKYEIDFEAPEIDADGKKTANAKFRVVKLNGKVLHEDVEMSGPTPGGVTGKEAATGPIMFQGDHGPVAYRNIVISPLE